MLKYLYPYKYLNKKAPKGYYYFALSPNPYFSYKGQCLNCKESNIQFHIQFKNEIEYKLHIITSNLNTFVISSGMGGLLY